MDHYVIYNTLQPVIIATYIFSQQIKKFQLELNIFIFTVWLISCNIII